MKYPNNIVTLEKGTFIKVLQFPQPNGKPGLKKSINARCFLYKYAMPGTLGLTLAPCQIVTWSCCHIVILSCCHNVVLPYLHIQLLNRQIVKLPNRRTVILSHVRNIKHHTAKPCLTKEQHHRHDKFCSEYNPLMGLQS